LKPFLNRVQYFEVDIKEKSNEKWFHRYRYEIPVIHFNNRLLFKNKEIDLKLLDKKLLEFESLNEK